MKRIKLGLHKKNKITACFCLLFSVLGAQNPNSKPQFLNFNKITFSYNPSWQLEENTKYQINFLYSSRLGNFSSIRSLYSSFIFGINGKVYFNLEGLSYQTGEFFQKNRVYLGAMIPIKLSENLTTSFGANSGLINYHFLPSTSGNGGSDFSPDINLGASLSYKQKFEIGFSGSQIINPKLRPIEYEFLLERYFELQLGYQDDISPDFSIENLLILRDKDNSRVLTRVSYLNSLIAGFNYHSVGLFAGMLGYEYVLQDKLNILLSFAYQMPIKSVPVSREGVELYAAVNNVGL